MKNEQILKNALLVIVDVATAIVALNELWIKAYPEIKKVIDPIIKNCKNLATTVKKDEIKVIAE